MESEYETVRLEVDGDDGPASSPWEGGAVPLRHSVATDERERERRIEIVARSARRRRIARRGLAAIALLAMGGTVVALLGSGGEEKRAPASLQALVRVAPNRKQSETPAADARTHRHGQLRHARRAPRQIRVPSHRAPHRAREAVAEDVGADSPETPAPEATPPEPASVEPAPEATPSGGSEEAAEAEFGFEH